MMRRILLLACISWTGLSGQDPPRITLHTDHLEIRINEKGHLAALIDRGTGKDYLAAGQPAPLLSLGKDGRMLLPDAMAPDAAEGTLHLEYGAEGIRATIRYASSPTHASFELTAVEPGEDVELVLWGPYPASIKEIVGETVGVVRNEAFAIGIQGLNLKTLGGYPATENDVMPMYDIFSGSDYSDISMEFEDKDLYRGDTARVTEYGSSLQAFTRNRRQDRVIANWGHEKYFVPAFEEGVTGSRIALFGCPESAALDTIGRIEQAEGLPHPVIDGAWGKISPQATAAYLIIGFGEEDIDEAIRLTREAGLKYLYHGGPFETWGHFKLNAKQFPNGWAGMKRCVEKAKESGVRLGVHTLSNFITTNDPYVTPDPDPRLAKVGESVLAGDVDAAQKEIPIEDPSWFDQMKNNALRTAMVGRELIRYGSVSKEKPYRLLDCERGAFGTQAASHRRGEAIAKLMDHPYNTFLAGFDLQEEMAARLARFFNETGLRQISFDGLEGCWAAGHGQYDRTRFVKTWYDHLSNDLRGKVITDASNPGHYFWHIYTRMNWGEPWYAGFRESQTRYRLKNQRYFYRNLMPAMLGWFRMTKETSLEDAEWLLARAAGFDAGFCLVTSPDTVRRNGKGGAILETVKHWEAARMAGAFTAEQKKGLRDIAREFHLARTAGEGSWDLHPVHSVKGVMKEEDFTFAFPNPHQGQPLQFFVQAAGDTRAPGLVVRIDGGEETALPLPLDAGAIIHHAGDGTVCLLDQCWNEEKRLSVDPAGLSVSTGPHSVRFSCRFEGGKDPALKIECRTLGAAERIQARRR